MKNQVIKALNVAHGERVLKYWKGIIGSEALLKVGDAYKENNCSDRYYGIIGGVFGNYTLEKVREVRAEIIQLPEEHTFPRVMMVWDNLYAAGVKRVVFAFKNGLYISWVYAETLNDAETETATTTWRYAEEIDEPKTVELTVARLLEKTSEIKKLFGLDNGDELIIKM